MQWRPYAYSAASCRDQSPGQLVPTTTRNSFSTLRTFDHDAGERNGAVSDFRIAWSPAVLQPLPTSPINTSIEDTTLTTTWQ